MLIIGSGVRSSSGAYSAEPRPKAITGTSSISAISRNAATPVVAASDSSSANVMSIV